MTQPTMDPSLGCRGSTDSIPGFNSIFLSCLLLCSFRIYGGALPLVGIFFCDLFPAFCFTSGHAGVSFKGFLKKAGWLI